jgi:Ice-binding-like
MRTVCGRGLGVYCRVPELPANTARTKIATRASLRKCNTPLTAAAVLAALALTNSALTGGAEAQILGTAADFGVLAGSTVTNTGSSVIQGNLGVSPGSAVTGFPPGIVVAPGVIHAADAVAGQAQVDLTTAYNTLQGLPSQVNLTGQNLGGLNLSPAVYSFATSAQLTGVLTLNGQGNTAGQFVFQIGSTLTTASNSAVLLINGANGNNVYWAVGSSATLGTNSAFAGNIVALTSITLNTGATLTCGRALARNGAVTLDSNTITLCAVVAEEEVVVVEVEA